MSEILELAERCEKADGGDRDLDAAIAIELFDGGADHLDDPRDVTRARKVVLSHGARLGSFEVVGFSGVSLRTAATYTGSLDAAMTLVPEGLRWCVDTCAGRPHSFIEDAEDFSDEPLYCKANAATPALALCAAALRARAAPRSKGEGE